MIRDISTTHPEWPRAWDALADVTGSYSDCCPETGEVWQYMGTVTRGRYVVHQFRHRNRPAGARPINGGSGRHADRVYLELVASHEYCRANYPDGLTVLRVHVKPYIDDGARWTVKPAE